MLLKSTAIHSFIDCWFFGINFLHRTFNQYLLTSLNLLHFLTCLGHHLILAALFDTLKLCTPNHNYNHKSCFKIKIIFTRNKHKFVEAVLLLFFYHISSSSFSKWPAYRELMNARYFGRSHRPSWCQEKWLVKATNFRKNEYSSERNFNIY